jgi:RNA polymerase sigma factor (sigma-70 family)
MGHSTDTELMIQVRDGDVRQLAPLFTRHHVRLYNFYLRLTNHRQVSEDLVQEVFFRILKYRHTFRGEGEFLTWMFHLARNVHHDHFRKHRNDQGMSDATEEIAADAPLAHEEMQHKEEQELLRHALALLPVEKKEVLILSRFEQMRYDAIAELLGCSVEAVKVRVHRAVQELRSVYFQLSGENQ